MAAIETTPQAGSVTLATGTTETVVDHYGVSTGSHVSLTPTNAAAASIDSLGPWVEAGVPDKGQFTIHHAASSETRTFSYSFVTPRK